MQEEKSWVYTLILGICMLLCLLLIGRMLLGGPAHLSGSNDTQHEDSGQEETQMGIQIGEQELCTLISQALPFQLEEMTLHIRADQTISIRAAVHRQELENSGLIPGSLRTALLFLPDSCKVYGAWSVTLQDSTVELQCSEAKIADIALPDEITGPLSEHLGAAINRVLEQQKLVPEALQWEDGSLTVIP